jgi:chemotaxis response regulator CheB
MSHHRTFTYSSGKVSSDSATARRSTASDRQSTGCCSAAQYYGQHVVGVLLTGMLRDGVTGLTEIEKHGGLTVVQDPAEAPFPDLPQNALAAVEVDACLPVAQIRALVMQLHT